MSEQRGERSKGRGLERWEGSPLSKAQEKRLKAFLKESGKRVVAGEPPLFLPSEKIGVGRPLRLREDGEVELILDVDRPWAMGRYRAVLRAFELFSGRMVAIHAISLTGEELKRRVEKEIFYSEKLRGVPGIVQTYRVFRYVDAEGVEMAELVREFYDLGPLWPRLLGGGLVQADKKRIASSLFSGIRSLHREGLLHQDLKPSNILLKSGLQGGVEATIGDLEAVFPLEGGGEISATPLFLPPEIWNGRLERLSEREMCSLYTEKAELWAFGCLLFQLYASPFLPWHGLIRQKSHFLDFSDREIEAILEAMRSWSLSLPRGEPFSPLLRTEPSKRDFFY